jgi:exopolysaccharide biosynthesis protein
VPDKVIIMQVTGDNYVGSLACVKDPTQLSLQKAKLYGSYGELIESYCENNVLAINASGFRDADGVGTGGTIVGSYVLDGKEYGYPDAGYLFFGFKNDNRLYISWGIGDKSEYKWAMQFSPALVSNGKSLVEGSNGWGMQPRSAIGQTKDGEVLLLVVDGRQVGYSIGCTVGDCADIHAAPQRLSGRQPGRRLVLHHGIRGQHNHQEFQQILQRTHAPQRFCSGAPKLTCAERSMA